MTGNGIHPRSSNNCLGRAGLGWAQPELGVRDRGGVCVGAAGTSICAGDVTVTLILNRAFSVQSGDHPQ